MLLSEDGLSSCESHGVRETGEEIVCKRSHGHVWRCKDNQRITIRHFDHILRYLDSVNVFQSAPLGLLRCVALHCVTLVFGIGMHENKDEEERGG